MIVPKRASDLIRAYERGLDAARIAANSARSQSGSYYEGYPSGMYEAISLIEQDTIY